jgi:hypothetical protein
MAKEPVFNYKGNSFSAALVKLERDKVYGWTETKYRDFDDNPCTFMTILDDGKTMLGTGALALRSIDAAGNEVDKSTLQARYSDGTEAQLLPSVFDKETELDDTKTIQDYLDMDVKAVYQLRIGDSTSQIMDILKDKKVLYFHFNYRAGYEQDDAFLIAQGDHIFAVIGRLTEFQYSTLEIPTVLEDVSDESSDDLDFNMF